MVKGTSIVFGFTMVMMYSLSFVTAVYAVNNLDKVNVHITNSSIYDGVESVKVTVEKVGGGTATSIFDKKDGLVLKCLLPDGFLPTTVGGLKSVIVTLLPGGASFEKSKSSEIGNGTLNIDIEPIDIVLTSELTIVKTINGDPITDDKEFGFTVTGPTTRSISVGADPE